MATEISAKEKPADRPMECPQVFCTGNAWCFLSHDLKMWGTDKSQTGAIINIANDTFRSDLFNSWLRGAYSSARSGVHTSHVYLADVQRLNGASVKLWPADIPSTQVSILALYDALVADELKTCFGIGLTWLSR